MSAQTIELRCPQGPRGLLMKIRQGAEKPQYVEGNLLELHCRDCTKNARAIDPSVKRILHQFNFAGELVTSVAER